jgi:hypothetical protein
LNHFISDAGFDDPVVQFNVSDDFPVSFETSLPVILVEAGFTGTTNKDNTKVIKYEMNLYFTK